MEKLKVNDVYIDQVIDYFNELLELEPGMLPEGCGMCMAVIEISDDTMIHCNLCPITKDRTGINCSFRTQLRTRLNHETYSYADATKESIEDRVKWMIEQVNKFTESDWEIFLK